MEYQIEVYSAGLDHPECVAIAPDGKVWAGGEAGQIYVIDPDTRQPDVLCRLQAMAAGLAFDRHGYCYVCSQDNTVVRVSPGGEWEVFCSSVDGRPLRAPNFPAFGPDGSLYVSGSGDYPGPTGEIYRIDPDGSAEVFHSGPFHYANGLAIDYSAEYLYVAQTATDDVVRVPLDGSGAPPEQVCAPGALLPMPDGLAFDSGQNLYVTSFGASALERIRPDGEIELVARDERGLTINRATNCAFGGPNLERLYVANLGGWHISVMTPDIPGRRLFA